MILLQYHMSFKENCSNILLFVLHFTLHKLLFERYQDTDAPKIIVITISNAQIRIVIVMRGLLKQSVEQHVVSRK